LNSVNINTVNLSAFNANITNLTAGNLGVTNLTAANATITNSLVVKPGATVDLGGNRVQNVVGGVLETDAANMGQLRTVEKMARQQGAIAAAATAIPLVAGNVGETTVGAGLGASGGQGALAIGLSSRITEDLIIKANAGMSGSTKSIGVGIGFTFK
jgi:trimeric autotransporter adhesin